MASTSFRDSMNSLGWSRREQPANTNRETPLLGSLSKYNPFNAQGNVRLPTTEGEGPGAPLPARSRREEEEGWFARKSTTSSCPSLHAPHHCYYCARISARTEHAAAAQYSFLDMFASCIRQTWGRMSSVSASYTQRQPGLGHAKQQQQQLWQQPHAPRHCSQLAAAC